jgi:hypothetical protein
VLQDAFVSDPSTIVKNGQVVNVRVSSWDENASRLSLTMRLTTDGGANADSNGTGLSDDGQARRNPRQGKVATSGNVLAAANPALQYLRALSVLAVMPFCASHFVANCSFIRLMLRKTQCIMPLELQLRKNGSQAHSNWNPPCLCLIHHTVEQKPHTVEQWQTVTCLINRLCKSA